MDIDERMIEFLKFNYPQENAEFVLSDIRNFDVSKYQYICANLPYNITTELITYLLISGDSCKKYVMMCQTETLNHFIDTSGKEYGPTSVLIHLLGEIKKVFNVKPGSFYPSPKCVSTVFEINIKETFDRKEAINAYVFAKKMFLNRRKTILNNLVNEIKDKEKALEILNDCNISPNTRPEMRTPEKFLELSKKVD